MRRSSRIQQKKAKVEVIINIRKQAKKEEEVCEEEVKIKEDSSELAEVTTSRRSQKADKSNNIKSEEVEIIDDSESEEIGEGSIEEIKPRRSLRIKNKSKQEDLEDWDTPLQLTSESDFLTPKKIKRNPKKNPIEKIKQEEPNLPTPTSIEKRTRKGNKKEDQVIELSSETGIEDEESYEDDDESLSSLSSIDSSEEFIEPVRTNRRNNNRSNARNNNRTSTRANRRRVNDDSSDTGGYTKGYLRTHPTLDPRVIKNHPEVGQVWQNIDKMKVIPVALAEQPKDLKLKLLPFQKEGLNWMIKQEQSEFTGGILADEMGMGKTIQMISLLLNEPRHKPNLLIAPTVALMQWLNEINTHTTSFKVLLYYGNDRTKLKNELIKYDIVLTTYNIIESGFRKQMYGFKRKGEMIKEKSILHQIEWFRVILDEGHYIKDRSCSTARSVFALNTKHKWALTGTPLQNRVGELYSLIRFLKSDPFSYYFCRECKCKTLTWNFKNYNTCDDCGHSPMKHFCWWNAEILKPIQKYGTEGEGKLSFQKLTKLLDRIMLRRTKVERADDLGLPPKIVTVRRDVFNEEEEDMYESLFSDTKRKFNTYVEEGTVLNHYANIFELITKMRLAVNHPDLILKRIAMKRVNEDDAMPTKVSLTKIQNKLICCICQDEAEDPIVSKCKHVFCREDVRQFLDSSIELKPKCPSCYVPLTIDLSQPSLINEDEERELREAENNVNQINDKDFKMSGETFRGSIVNRIDMKHWRSSTKIEALVEELDKLRAQDHTIKSIVFSQFVNFLDLVAWRLHRAGFACCRLDGRMRPAQRDAIIKTFMQRHEFTVFLISLKAGGIALNLTEASRVFICDPWWNPAVEEQAMDRIHRLGQHRPIQITRLIVENSIESRILQLQVKKHALFQSTIGKDTSALAKLTEEDLRFLFVL